jgi:carbon-monoxide dehydrogenase small subunit
VDVDYRLADAGGTTRVFVEADIKLSGAIAQFGRTGLVEEISKRLIDEFVFCLHAKLTAETPEAAATIKAGEVKGFSLFFAGFTSWIGKFFKRLFQRGDE